MRFNFSLLFILAILPMGARGAEIVKFGATLCGVGQYLSDGACVSKTRGDCPENFYDITVSDVTMTPRENAICASGYKSFWLTANCASGDTQHNMCAILCDGDLTYTGTGACAALCPGVTRDFATINATGGRTWPLYSTRVTAPSVNVQTTGGVCYGNLVQGSESGTVNVTVGGTQYHLTD